MPNFNDNPTNGYPRVKYRKVVIPESAVKTLNATPVELVPDPGDGAVHLVHMVYIHKPAGTAYTLAGAGELVVRYNGGAGNDITQIDASDFATGNAVRKLAQARHEDTGNADIDVSASNNVELILNGSDEYAAGDSPFNVHIYYQTVVE